MSRNITIVTRKGQITIPAGVRRELGIREGDRMTVTREGDRLLLESQMSIVERTAGMLSKYRLDQPLSAEEERAATEKAIAEEVAREMADE
ncbi:MAG TPA: AbrB/MazE/SpoVT family DNA-binding domain-containing protein [Thermomicrobiales bacterium]|nr:AbrB/MazE/SpoVT family DNA-binding domain-containing protein [Thermomicrobiales bacterium]